MRRPAFPVRVFSRERKPGCDCILGSIACGFKEAGIRVSAGELRKAGERRAGVAAPGASRGQLKKRFEASSDKFRGGEATHGSQPSSNRTLQFPSIRRLAL